MLSPKRKTQRGFALLMVVLILAALLIIGVPFAISMRLSSERARTSLADARARYAAEGAYNHAVACLMRTQELDDPYPDSLEYIPFLPHTLDVPAELEVVFEPEEDSGYHDRELLDLADEITTRDPRGVTWSVDVEDEQGKINVNSAPRTLIENLLAMLGVDVAGADELLNQRQVRGRFNSVSEVQAVLAEFAEEGQLVNLASYITVHSERLNSSAPHPINVNSAPQAVLAATLRGLRLRTVEAIPGADNKGNGSVSPIMVSRDATPADWVIVFTGETEATITMYAEDGTTQTFNVGADGASTNQEGVELTIFTGTEPFDVGDSFTFSTRAIDDTLARRLADAMQAEMEVEISTGYDSSLSFPADEVILGGEGHLLINGLTARYWHLFGNYDCTDIGVEPDTYNARRVITEAADLDALESVINAYWNDTGAFDGVTEEHRDAARQAATRGLVAAIKLNSFRPLSADLNGSTAPFCFATSDVYTITARGTAYDTAGNNLATRGVRRIVSIKRPLPHENADAGYWTLDAPSAFESLLHNLSGANHRAASSTGENPNITPSSATGTVKLRSRKLPDDAVHPAALLHFGGDVQTATTALKSGLRPLSYVPDKALEEGEEDYYQWTNVPAFEDGSLAVVSSRSCLAYHTGHMFRDAEYPKLDGTCKSIEMWVHPLSWDDERDYFLFDSARPYDNMPELRHTNRIALFYDGAAEELVFRLSDASIAAVSSEIRYPLPLDDVDGWFHVQAIWSGLNYGQMTLLIDGKAGGEWTYTGADEGGPVISGNIIFEEDGTEPSRGTSGEIDNLFPPQIYGYDYQFRNAHTVYTGAPESNPFDDLSAYRPSTLASGFSASPTTTTVVRDDEGNLVPIPADATEIPVEDTDEFPDTGFLLIGTEIVFYESKDDTTFTQCLRGVNIGPGYYGNDPVGTLGKNTEAQIISTEMNVELISLHLQDATGFPEPRYIASAYGSAAGFFGIASDSRNYVLVNEEEFISYTHRVSAEFLVNADGSMRGQHNTTPVDHSPLAGVLPVYRVNFGYAHPGGPGADDKVTIVDDDLNAAESTIIRTGSDRNYVVFSESLPPARISRKARMVKFPSSHMYASQFLTIGANSGPKGSGDGSGGDESSPYAIDLPAQAVIDEFKISLGDDRIPAPRLLATSENERQNVTEEHTGEVYILLPYFWHQNFGIKDMSGRAVERWPASGFALIGEEIVSYRTLHGHQLIDDDKDLGSLWLPPGEVEIDEVFSTGAANLTPRGGKTFEEAGFNQTEGYATIYSYERHDGYTPSLNIHTDVWNDFAGDWLDEAQRQDYEDTGSYNEDSQEWTFEGQATEPWYSSVQEVVKYEVDGNTLKLTERGLFGTDAIEHKKAPPLQAGEDERYPVLRGNVAALQIVERRCLGTTPAEHAAGTPVMPLYHIVSTAIEMQDEEDANEDRLYVESHAHFPDRGYLAVSDGTNQEIIGYTGKDTEGVEDVKYFFTGVKYLRRRFGTPLVELQDGTIARLFHARYDDRLPVDADGEFAWQISGSNLEGHTAYLELSRNIRGARWNRIQWIEGIEDTWNADMTDERENSGTEIFILARVNGKPDWQTEPVRWDSNEDKAGRIILLDDPAELNEIDVEGDLIELRVYFKYNENFADENGNIKPWMSPMLRGLRIGYKAPISVYQQEEIYF